MNLDEMYPHVRVVLGIILGLGIAALLTGIASIIENPRRLGWSAIHMSWVAWALISIVTYWWWEFSLSGTFKWTFASYFFLVAYSSLYFLLARMLFPVDMRGHDTYEANLIERRVWFFTLVALITLLDVYDTSLKGASRWRMLGEAYPAHTVTMLAIAGVGIWRRERRVHLALALLAAVYQTVYLATEYFTLDGG
jgi:hypothetical protein